MTSYKIRPNNPKKDLTTKGSLENLYEKIRDLKTDFQHVEEKMRSAVESLPHTDRGGHSGHSSGHNGYYPGKFTEKMERRGLAVSGGGGQSYLQLPVQQEEGRRGKVLRSWTPWPPWTIRWEKVREEGNSDVQTLCYQASVVEYQI